MEPHKSASTIPEGYTFFNYKLFVSRKAVKVVEDLLEKADNRNPDLFDMYIYNRYYHFALLDLVDSTLTKIHTKIIQKNWDEAMTLLEALAVFQEMDDSWPMCHDREHTEFTNTVYGASLVTVLRALKEEGRLNTANFPSLETILRLAAEWGEAISKLCGGSYHLLCKAIGARLFSYKTERIIALEKERVKEWIASLDEEEQEEVRETMEEEEEEEEEEAKELAARGHVEEAWYAGGEDYNEHELEKDKEFVLSRVWKEYKEYLRSEYTLPRCGPPCWDINRWTEEDKRPFKFSNLGVDDDIAMF